MERPAGTIHERVIEELELRPEYVGAVEEIPATGPLVVVANHPFGIVEGPILGALFGQVRRDVLFVTNSLLAELPELCPQIIAVDPFGGASHANTAAVRQALKHLQGGGALVVFPAGEVSSVRPKLGRVADSDWQPMAARLAMKTGARVLPVYFDGHNGPGFQLAGLIHPALRTLLLPSQMLARRRRTVRVAVGRAMGVERFRDAGQMTMHLRNRVYALAAQVRQARVAAELPADAIGVEIGRLQPVLAAGSFEVYLEPAGTIPTALREIGRLRELTFRAAGEGTGAAVDLDEFDAHYWHLFVWHRENREIAGAYRIADCAALPPRPGSYTSTLFRFPRDWRRIAGQAAELGRSFIRARYQRDYLPLLLLWKGIGVFVMRRPHLRYLFGPVSISADYTAESRSAIAAHFSPWPKGFFPRNPMTHALVWGKGGERRRSVEELEAYVTQLEPDAKGLPVLLRQYLNLGGEILCLNLDGRFGNALDGLVLLDLTKAPARLLGRYFGEEAVRRFTVITDSQGVHRAAM